MQVPRSPPLKHTTAYKAILLVTSNSSYELWKMEKR